MLRFWLCAMDVLSAVGLSFSKPWMWCLSRASDQIDWGDVPLEPREVICHLCNGEGCKRCAGEGRLYVDENDEPLPSREDEFDAEVDG